MQAWWFKCLMLAVLLGGVVFGMQAEVDAKALPIEASLWFGQEYEACGDLLGNYIGGEVYAPGVFFYQDDLGRLTLESFFNGSVYDSSDWSLAVGLRTIFDRWSLGAGIDMVSYDDNGPYLKEYIWASTYSEDSFARLYLDANSFENPEYGTVKFEVDWLNRPIGVRASGVYNETPLGITYEELRADLSLYLGYPCPVCWDSDYDCDLRLYGGFRLAHVSDPISVWFGDWAGLLAGLRIITPPATAFAEFQFLYEDPWSMNPIYTPRIIWGASISLKGLMTIRGID